MSEHVVFVEMSMTGAGERCLEYARHRGYAVTVVARAPARYAGVPFGPGELVACDTNDLRALLDAVAALHARHPIDGIATTHDFYTPHAARAAATMGLPGLRYDAAAGVRNKHHMRLTLERHSPDLNPPFRLVRTEAEALSTASEWGFPLIAKPPDANDSWNVALLTAPARVAEYMRAAATWRCNSAGQAFSPGVLLEGFIDGTEHSVETVQHPGGAIQLMGVTGKRLLGVEAGHFAEAGILFPLRGPAVELIFREVSRALAVLGIDCGVIHTECRVTDGRVKILEVNPRLAGDMTGSHMIELALGASAVEQVVEVALGHPAAWRPTRQAGAGKYSVCMPETGRFGAIENLEQVRRLPGVAGVRVMASAGDRCWWPPRSNLDLLARVVAGAGTPEEALRLATDAAAQARVRVLGD
jgi:cysteine synthase A